MTDQERELMNQIWDNGVYMVLNFKGTPEEHKKLVSAFVHIDKCCAELGLVKRAVRFRESEQRTAKDVP